MIDVLCFGEALVDFFPGAPGQKLVDCDLFHRHLGGAPTNVAVGLARLGVRVGLMTLVGPDDFGAFVRARLEIEGVDVRGVGRHPSAKTGVTFVEVGTAGERRFLFFRHPSADQMIDERDLDLSLIEAARVLHVGSSTLSREPARAATRKAVALARANGRLISCDPNWRAHLWENRAEAEDNLRWLIASSDVLKVSDDELEDVAGTSDVEAAAARLRAQGPTLVLVTLGARGAYFDSPAGRGRGVAPTVQVVDSTGAGDGFMAGLLATLSPRLANTPLAEIPLSTIEEAVARGNFVGSQVVTKMGATSGLPRI